MRGVKESRFHRKKRLKSMVSSKKTIKKSKAKKPVVKPEDIPLTAKMKRFCNEYIIDLNGTQAAIRTKIKPASAAQYASEQLRKPNAKKYIQSIANKRLEKTELTSENVLKELSKLAFSNMDDFVTLKDGMFVQDFEKVTRDQMAAVQEFTIFTDASGNDRVKLKLYDKKGAAELLGKYFKLFTDKIEHSGAIDLSGASKEELEDIIKNG